MLYLQLGVAVAMLGRGLKVYCPKCRKAMKPSERKPVLFTGDVVEISYICKQYGTTEKRTVKQDEVSRASTTGGAPSERQQR